MKYFIILTINLLLLANCSQTIYLSNPQEKAEVIRNKLLDKKLEIHFKDGSSRNNFIYNVKQDTITTIDYDWKSENTSINSIPFDELQSIIYTDEVADAGTAGFILGSAPMFMFSAEVLGSYSSALLPAVVFGCIGWIIGNNIEIYKKYRFVPPTTKYFNFGVSFGIFFPKANNTWIYIHPHDDSYNGNYSPSLGSGYSIGFVLEHYLFENLDLQYNISYQNSALQWGENRLFGDSRYISLNIYSLSTRILLKMHTPFINKTFICVGVQHERNLEAKRYFIGYTKSILNDINQNQFGIMAGLQLPFFFDEMRTNLMWQYNFKNLYKKNYQIYDVEFPDKNRFHVHTITLSLDYLFN